MALRTNLAALSVALLLQACASAPRPAEVAEAPIGPPAYFVGGHVVGLRGIGLVLQNESTGERVRVDEDGKFVFGHPVKDGATYSVAVAQEPISPLQTCAIGRSVGRIDGRSSMEIIVLCDTVSFDEPPALVGSLH